VFRDRQGRALGYEERQGAGSLARAGPETLRYKILHAAARITRGAHRRQLKIQASWP
jgi:hypothetical protein